MQDQRGAFTLIELIAVMAIILILAGLILGIAGHAQHQGSVKRAESEIKAMSAALESYKIDNGTYPRNTATDTLNAQVDFDPGTTGGTNKYQAASEYLYQCLSGNLPAGQTIGKAYINFSPNQLAIAADGGGANGTVAANSPYMYIQDPFGFSYGYSTAYLKALDDPNAVTPTTVGYNPTFDLWSTVGYSASGGKATPTSNTGGSDASTYSGLWEKNW